MTQGCGIRMSMFYVVFNERAGTLRIIVIEKVAVIGTVATETSHL